MGQEKSSHLGNFGKEDSDMNRGVTWRLVLCLTAMLSSVSLARADYEAGQTAWQAGRHAEALTQWQAAAKTEDARAMLALGRAYVKGLGVPQDYVEAHKWLNLAAARGNAEAATERDALAAKMTTEEQAEARRLVRAWRSGGKVEPPKSAAVPRAAPPSSQADPPPPRAIREAQALMTALGYKPGPADGLWGGRTGRAYAAFLRDAGLPPGDMLTPEALRAMRAAAKGRNVAAATASPRQAPASQRQADPPPADLHRLVAAGDIDGLKAALAKGAGPNTRDGKGWTPLMRAADNGRTLLIPPLLKAGADPNIRASDGATALFIAAVHEHYEIISSLMKAGADGSIKGPKGTTAADLARMAYGGLEAARRKGASSEVLALLEKGLPTPGELEQEIKNDKEIIKRKFLNCGKFPILRSKYSNSENYHGIWYAFSRVMFLNSEITIEISHYEEESSKIKPAMRPKIEKDIYTFSILDIRARVAYEDLVNPNTGVSIASVVLEGIVKLQRKGWDADYSRHPILWLPKTDESHDTLAIIFVCDRSTAHTVSETLNKLNSAYKLFR